MGAVYTDRIPFSKRIGGQLNYAHKLSVLTDSQVSAAANVSALRAAVVSATSAANFMYKKAGQDAVKALDAGQDLSLFTDNLVSGAATVASIVSATDVTSASPTFKQNFFG